MDIYRARLFVALSGRYSVDTVSVVLDIYIIYISYL